MPDDLDTFLNLEDEFKIVHSNEKTAYINLPAAFDIETSSFYENGEKRAIMYVWQFGLNGNVIIGRTWEQFDDLIAGLIEVYEISKDQRLRIYIHNEAFEFQWIRRRFEWDKVFAVSERTPLFARTVSGIEFACSYLLSGFALSSLADQLQTYKVRKLSGDLDYSLIRHSETSLTDQEIGYCVNDVLVVMAYIQEEIDRNEGMITNIPFTKTGYVRRYCRKACQRSGKRYLNYRKLMDALTLTAPEYRELKRAFQGGFTHANPRHSGKIMKDVDSFDFTSSYPYVMLSERFPMGKGELIEGATAEDVIEMSKKYSVLFDAEFVGLYSVFWEDNYISASKCWIKEGAVVNNGRIVDADRIRITLTDVDLEIIRATYKWTTLTVHSVYRYRRDYLPRNLIRAIIKLYKDKTELKDVPEKVVEYLVSKGMLNAVYGMCVTDIVRDVIACIGGEWMKPEPADMEKEIARHNKSRSRFLFYPWGVWVTAYARRNLWSGILAVQDDYIYSDTDSIKLRNLEKHRAYFDEYNEIVVRKLKRMCEALNIPFDDLKPRTIEGKEKLIGVWDHETKKHKYSRFKTLGAKRYMVEAPDVLTVKDKDGNKTYYPVSLTVSGVNKFVAIPYLLEKYGQEKIFEAFDEDLDIPPEASGKLTHTYIDEPTAGSVTDYTGRRAEYAEKSSVHLEPAPYHMSLASAYIDYLKGFRDLK